MPLTPRELFNKALRGEFTPRPPFWFMRQAGRYLPEYRKLREGKSFEEMLMNPEMATEITLQPIRRFDMDAAIIFSDILTPLYGMTRGLKIIPSKGPVVDRPLTSPRDVDTLKKTTPKEDFPYLAESLRMVRQELPHHALIGFSGAPFTLASYLIEGASTRDALKTKVFALKYPEAFSRLMKLLTDVVIEQLLTQKQQGVDAIQVFDSWGGFLPPKLYEELVKPHLWRIFVHSDLKNLPTIFYARGSSHLLSVLKDLPCSFFSIDFTLTLQDARQIVGPNKGLQGNLDPSYLLSTKEVIVKETTRMLREGSTHLRYIFNLAVGINKNTPVENVEVLVQTIKQFSRDESHDGR